MTQPPPILPKSETDAFLASGLAWLGWLLAVIITLGAPRRSRTLRRWLEKLERFVEHTIFLMAMQRLVRPPAPRRAARPRNTPAGFRRAASRPRFVFKLGRIRARGKTWRQRAQRLVAALAHPEPYVARFLQRLRKALRLFSFVAAAPPAHACASVAAPGPSFVDDS